MRLGMFARKTMDRKPGGGYADQVRHGAWYGQVEQLTVDGFGYM